MINTDYSSLYGQYINARNNGKSNGRMKDKTHMSDSMEYLAKAKAEADKIKQSEKTADSSRRSGSKEITQDDIKKLYAQLNGINYGAFEEGNSTKSMANAFLNQMVFSPMSSSKDLFIPQMSRSMLSAAFNAAYDDSGEIEQIQNTGRDSDSENFDVDSE